MSDNSIIIKNTLKTINQSIRTLQLNIESLTQKHSQKLPTAIKLLNISQDS